MSCFCRSALSTLTLKLPKLDISLPPLPRANFALSLSAQLGSLGLPALPWVPDPSWLSLGLQLPKVSLSATAMATISALAQLRASVLATLGIDLLIPAQAAAFARVAATLNARLQAHLGLGLNLDARLLIRLGTLNAAVDQIQLAMKLGLFSPTINANFGIAGLPQWRVFLSALLSLAPVIAIAAQLHLALDANFAVNLSASVRALLAIKLPEINVTAALNLVAALSAMAGLKASLGLGIDPVKIGLPGIQALIQAKLNLIPPNLVLPRFSFFCPTLMATPAVVNLAASIHANALVGLNWQVPPITAIAALRIGLPTIGIVAALGSLSVNAVLAAPCGAICDANTVLRAAMAA